MAVPSIQIDWAVFSEWSDSIRAIIHGGQLDVFSTYSETCGAIATEALVRYQGYLKGQPLPNGASVQHPSGNLAKQAELVTGSGFCEWSLVNDESYAEAIEKGTKERDLKEMLPTAKKARRAKDGTLYLIIPFRHGTPGTVGLKAMPSKVHQIAQKLSRSRVTGKYAEVSGTGHMVNRHTYKWGDKLTNAQIVAAGGTFKDQNRFQGMYKFGNEHHTSYITFRVMSEKSAGWVVPARPGLWPARTAAESAIKEGSPLLAEAILDDIKRLAGL